MADRNRGECHVGPELKLRTNKRFEEWNGASDKFEITFSLQFVG